ncbi:MAG: thioesterase family protein [Gammaproteobacteria bacterium]|nr:thioesterase family protein [Gammaproteobacteria bacterium]
MPRVKVTTPDNPRFRMERKVGITDLNYARHLDSMAMASILHEARLQMLADLGFTEGNIYGLGMVVTDFAIEYRSESFANDVLVIDVSVGEFNRYGCDIGFVVSNSALDQIVCKAKVGVVFMDFDKHQLADVPAAFKTRLEMPQARVA